MNDVVVDLSRFPWPDRWARPGRAVSLLVAAGLAVAAVVGIALLATGGIRDERGVLGLLTLPVLALLTLLVLRTRVQRRRDSTAAVRPATPDEAPAGVTIPYRRDTALLRGLLSTYLGLLGAALVVGGLVMLVQGGAGTGAVAALVGTGLLALVVPKLQRWVSARTRPPVLILTPEGLVHRTPRSQARAPWPDVISVVPSGDRDPHVLVALAQRAGADATTLRSTPLRPVADRLSPHLRIPASDVDVDPVLLLEVLRWYAEHPEARAELATRAGLERVRRARV